MVRVQLLERRPQAPELPQQLLEREQSVCSIETSRRSLLKGQRTVNNMFTVDQVGGPAREQDGKQAYLASEHERSGCITRGHDAEQCTRVVQCQRTVNSEHGNLVREHFTNQAYFVIERDRLIWRGSVQYRWSVNTNYIV